MTKKKGTKEFQKPLEEPPKPKPVEVPEPKLIDVMREIKTLRNDLSVAIEAVKALGADVIENNNMQSAALTDLNNQMQELQRAFINVVSKGFEAPATTPKQPTKTSTPTTSKTINLPQVDTWPISENAKKNVVVEQKSIGTTVRTKSKIDRADWDKLNTFLRALGMKWTSIKEQRIYEWRPI